MLTDANEISAGKNIESDICIIGAGAAGITAAREFINTKLKVCILESGGLTPKPETQVLNSGEITGLPYPLESSHLRAFGGTTGHWGGECRPLDQQDFEKRPWVPNSGWPFGRTQLDPYYKMAHKVLSLGDFDYDSETTVASSSNMLPIFTENLVPYVFKYNPLRFGEAFKDEIFKARNIDTFIHATALELGISNDGDNIQYVTITNLKKERFSVKAKVFILAAGGIENPRLLLLSNKVRYAGLGNKYDQVGRYFMDHPYFYRMGIAVLYDEKVNQRISESPEELTTFGFDNNVKRNSELLNCGFKTMPLNLPELSTFDKLGGDVYARYFEEPKPTSMRYWAKQGIHPLDVEYWTECAPNPESRVSLSQEKDSFGQQKTKLNWQLSDLEKESMQKALTMLGSEIGKSNAGRLWIRSHVRFDETWPPKLAFGFHHMGTTRMHENYQYGVVDGNSKVHDVDNLYIAGSSVFPTSGQANPTLTIVALAIRLANHLKGKMA